MLAAGVGAGCKRGCWLQACVLVANVGAGWLAASVLYWLILAGREKKRFSEMNGMKNSTRAIALNLENESIRSYGHVSVWRYLDYPYLRGVRDVE